MNRNGSYKRRWECGNTKKVAIGDEFLFVWLGVEPKGLIGCGYVRSIPYEEPHWDQAKRAKGMTARYTDIVFRVLSESPLISLDDLRGKFPNCNWTPQRNCVQVADSIGAGVLSILRDQTNQ